MVDELARNPDSLPLHEGAIRSYIPPYLAVFAAQPQNVKHTVPTQRTFADMPVFPLAMPFPAIGRPERRLHDGRLLAAGERPALR